MGGRTNFKLRGFGTGSALTFGTGHCEIVNIYNHMEPSGKSLIYFSLEYPLAPKAKYPEILDSALAAYFWLIQQVGVKNVVIGGDSGGANLVLSLHKQLLVEMRNNLQFIMPKSLVLISPWLDISLSHTPPHIIEHLSSTSDFLPYKMLEKWRDNVTPHGISPRDPSMSPFFDLDPLVMPRDGILLIYGSTEVFAPEIDDWVTSIRKQPEARSKLKVL